MLYYKTNTKAHSYQKTFEVEVHCWISNKTRCIPPSLSCVHRQRNCATIGYFIKELCCYWVITILNTNGAMLHGNRSQITYFIPNFIQAQSSHSKCIYAYSHILIVANITKRFKINIYCFTPQLAEDLFCCCNCMYT